MVISKQRSVAFCNKIMDTHLPQPVGCGDKYDVSGCGFGHMFSAFCMFFKYPSPDAKAPPSPARGEGLHRPWCHKILGTDCTSRPRMTGGRRAGFVRLLHRCIPHNDVCSVGRSMIEMLGVLAIIGVLSVGGIAGYSKAMEQYKINKAIDGYSHILFGITEHLQYIKKQKNGTHFNEFFRNINLLPPEWPYLHDNLGNYFNIYLRSNDLVFDMYLGGWVTNEDGKSVSANFSHSLCEKFVQNIATSFTLILKICFDISYSCRFLWG
ncbi:MAG: hypothetical protein SPC24_04790 [Alphaproteobacteria bacterium]|nr:hypothetical protein [Alphaproteobacteria bacterium]